MSSTPNDLDARILDAEARLIAREARLRRELTVLGEHVSHAARPQRWLTPVLGGAAALLVLKGLLRGRHREPAPPPRPSHDTKHAHHGEPHHHVPWVRMAAMAWPMVPERLRARVPPTVIHLAVMLAPFLPLLTERLARRRARTRDGG